MFHQVAPTVCWISKTDPKSMVNIGTEVLGLLYDSIVVFYNVKTEMKSYFKAESPQTSAGVSLLTGHPRYPLFAIAEAVLRPRIFVMRYPDMEKLTTIVSSGALSYIDLVFSEFGFLAGMSGHPTYTLYFWDYRNGLQMGRARTYKKSVNNCLYVMKKDMEVVIQYAFWNKQILIWQLCHSPDQDTLNEIATLDLNTDFSQSTFFPLSYFDGDNAYIVNDYGELFWIDVASMTLRSVWSSPEESCRSHALYSNKIGLLVVNSEYIYFIKRRIGELPEFNLEWTLKSPNGHFVKIVSDFNNNIYGATSLGNIELLQPTNQKTCELKPLFSSNCAVVDFTLLKGVKEEVVLILTMTGELPLVDLIKMNLFSKVNFEDACVLASHNAMPIVAVGTKTGRVHFLTYEKPRAPVLLGAVYLKDAWISCISLFDKSAFVADESNGVHIMLIDDFKSCSLRNLISLKPEPKNEWRFLDLNLLDEERAVLFISEDVNFVMQYASELWLYQWNVKDVHVSCTMFRLPYKYRDLTILQPYTVELVEIAAARLDSKLIDVLWLQNNAQLVIGFTLSTCHLTDLNAIYGTRNILTADTQSLVIHLRTHRKSKFAYHISRPLLCNYIPKVRVKISECFNTKYLLVLYGDGCLSSHRLPMLTDCLKENKLIEEEKEVNAKDRILPYARTQKKLKRLQSFLISDPAENDVRIKESILQELRVLEKSMRELIDYDLSIAGLHDVNFRKFCLNHKWLDLLEEESRILFIYEHETLVAAVSDQERIRDWIFELIKSKGTHFSTKLRSLFSNISVMSYTTRAPLQELLERFDLFRFYNMEPLEDEDEIVHDDDDKDELDLMGEEEEEIVEMKPLKRYIIEKGMLVYDHVMAKDFELQDVNIVTFNQMYNEEAKLRIILVDALKAEFNKRFNSSRDYKKEILDNVGSTNATLQKIYSNMNCMLCLLKMDQFTPPSLSVPEWTMDENIERILTVDDSEIKAINRRKKIVEAAAHISKRMLLWSKEFWGRALLIMMDGVLEKLWEEEIKKTPLPPEFSTKKQPHEFNLEEQRQYREYENKLKLLEEDRRKYLRILRENETKAHNLKKHFIMKLNEHIAEISIWKLKYDFAVKHERFRLLNSKLTNHKRIICTRQIGDTKNEIDKLVDYINKYEKLLNFFERSQNEFKMNYEMQLQRDRTLERQFKNQFLNTLPQHLTQDMARVYRRRPKLSAKVFSNAGICFEVAKRLLTKVQRKFPLPQELLDFLSSVDGMDHPSNCPPQVDLKYWEPFTKLRRQKIESELRLKGIGYQLNDMPKNISFFKAEVGQLKEHRAEKATMLELTTEEYFDTTQNQKLELILSMGQIEIGVTSLEDFRNAVLMHVDDINGVNEMIKDAGTRKLKAMQRVARFRRQVIFREWEHKVVRSNIEYLKYMLELIERCKVSLEFLEVLRNWEASRAMKETAYRVGYVEEVCQQRLMAARRNLEKIYQRIEEVTVMLEQKKRSNHEINAIIQNAKVNVTYLTVRRDLMGEEKNERKQNSRIDKAMQYTALKNKVKADFAKILELQTIWRIKNLSVNEDLPPIKTECAEYK